MCVSYAALLFWTGSISVYLLFLPLLLLLRMMLNALDGMIAAATNKQSLLGAVLNEVCDVISDIALFTAFVLIVPVSVWLWWLLIILSVMVEFVSLAVYQAVGKRPFSGPFGKSDRAVYLGMFAIVLYMYPDLTSLIYAYVIAGIILAVLTIFNRLKPVW